MVWAERVIARCHAHALKGPSNKVTFGPRPNHRRPTRWTLIPSHYPCEVASSMSENDVPIEYDLLKDVVTLNLKVLDTKIEHFQDNIHVKIVMKDVDPEAETDVDEDSNVLESCAWGLIFALGVLSFADARPRGVSDMHYVEKDDWRVGDMLRHLRFERGRLHFYADYVRGRMMKTTIEIDKDGTITLETVNRGEAATRWVSKLQGQKVIALVQDQASEPPID